MHNLQYALKINVIFTVLQYTCVRETEDITQSYNKYPYTNRNVKKAKPKPKNATKNFD